MKVKISELKPYQLCKINALLNGMKDHQGRYWIINLNEFEVNGIAGKSITSWNPDERYSVTLGN